MIIVAGDIAKTHMIGYASPDGEQFRIISICSALFNANQIETVVSLAEFKTCRSWCKECVADYLKRGG